MVDNLLVGGFRVFAQLLLNSRGCLIQMAKGIRIERSTMDGFRMASILKRFSFCYSADGGDSTHAC